MNPIQVDTQGIGALKRVLVQAWEKATQHSAGWSETLYQNSSSHYTHLIFTFDDDQRSGDGAWRISHNVGPYKADIVPLVTVPMFFKFLEEYFSNTVVLNKDYSAMFLTDAIVVGCVHIPYPLLDKIVEKSKQFRKEGI